MNPHVDVSLGGGTYLWSDFLGGYENPVASFRGGGLHKFDWQI